MAVNWAAKIKNNYDVHLILHKRKIKIQGTKDHFANLNNEHSINKILNDLKPHLVINTIALTDVNKCEYSPKLADLVNNKIPQKIARACSLLSIKFIHVSTDHLFDGSKSMVGENEIYSPLNKYGETKAEAELGIQKYCDKALIIRTNFFGWGLPYRKSFSDNIIFSLRKNMNINMYDDVFFTPILIEELIKNIHQLYKLNCHGIFNVVSSDRISKYKFSQIICDIFKLDHSLVIKTLAKEKKSFVKRPLDMSLSNYKLCKALKIQRIPLERSIKDLFKEEQKGLLKFDYEKKSNQIFFY